LRSLFASLLLLLGLRVLAAEGATVERSQIPDEYKWKLTDLYASDEAWTKAKEAFPFKMDAFARRKGHLGEGAKAIADSLNGMAALQNEVQRLQVYAESRSNEDVREAGPRAMNSEAQALETKLGAATSWVRPELLALPTRKLEAAAADARLRDFRFYLKEVLRWKRHTLPADEERLFSMAGELANTPAAIFTVLTNADLPYPSVKLSSGEEVRLDESGYEKARASPERGDRMKAFEGFFGALSGFQRTNGAILDATLRANVFDEEAHRFGSTLEAALFRDNIPTAVYHQLLHDVNANLATLHRYLGLRKRMMGLDRLGYEDLYPPLVKGVGRTYSIDEAKAMVVGAVGPLGETYQDTLRRAYQSGWVDFLPSTGKPGGAYETGVYGVHSFLLLNFNGRFEDVSTLAHESGHAMHTMLSYEHQPYATAEYPIFVAEVASTLNENLLFHAALTDAKSNDERLALLGQHLELLRTNLFRATMFAEFELAAHEAAERGEALTGEKLSQMYLGIVRHYYGHDQGVCQVADLYGVEWSYVSHFYAEFYVFQYATSVIASTALAKQIRTEEAQGGTATRDRYLQMLRSGGSDYGVELLRRAGVDMTTSAPFQAAIADMNETMDQIEAILAEGN